MTEQHRSLRDLIAALEPATPRTVDLDACSVLPDLSSMLYDAGLIVDDRPPTPESLPDEGATTPSDAFAAQLSAAFHSGALGARALLSRASLARTSPCVIEPPLDQDAPRVPRRAPAAGQDVKRARPMPLSTVGRSLYTTW